MTQLDLFYRAFGEYRKVLQKDSEISKTRNTIVHSEEGDKVTVIREICQVDEDWIEAIEQGLVFIGKAIGEERQFIRSNGEVEIIEKVKRVSRESVEHLAKHSNLITNEQPDPDDLIPGKLYTVERLTDYKVYENRFLYMLLCDIRDFVSFRYDQIVRHSNTYCGETVLCKSVSEGNRRMRYEVKLNEVREDDWYLKTQNPVGNLLDRINRMLHSVYYYLRTPLMVEVAKADKLKPPIVKTNVLRMDKNFKETVALYEFLTSYEKDGFVITREEKQLSPLKDEIAGELADSMQLLSFLTYEHGLGIEDYLKQEYEKEEALRREEQSRLLREQLESLRRRIKSSGANPEEYILLLEKRIRELEKDSEQLIAVKEEVKALHAQAEDLNRQIAEGQQELVRVNELHAKEMEQCNAEIERLHRQQAEQDAAHAEAIVRVKREKREELECFKAEQEKIAWENRAILEQKNREAEQLRKEVLAMSDRQALLLARLTALRREHGLLTETEDYTSEEGFQELEHQFEVFGSFVRGEWKDAKKLMRQEFLITLKKSVTGKSRRGQGASDPRNSSKKSSGKTALSPEKKEETTKAASAKAPVNDGQHRGTTVTGSPTEGKIESENGGTDE